jgi:Domain of unknown function (DUF4278)
MKLSYRGVQYNYNEPKADVVDSNVTGNYRGITYRLKQATNLALQPHANGLKYRGVNIK